MEEAPKEKRVTVLDVVKHIIAFVNKMNENNKSALSHPKSKRPLIRSTSRGGKATKLTLRNYLIAIMPKV